MDGIIKLGDKDSNEEILIENLENFDVSDKKEKKVKITILIMIILLLIIIILIIYFCLRSKCTIGKNEKCHSCRKNNNKCESCNPYFRLENGKCVFIYSFEAIYKSTKTNNANEETKLFNVESLIDYKINKIQVDDK